MPDIEPDATPADSAESNWQMELLMERLKSKSSQYKLFHEISKSMRMSLLVIYFGKN